jgi:integrase
VATAIGTGARRNELLALRWSDVDLDGKSLRITRAIEKTKAHGKRVKKPKTKTGTRTVTVDAGLAAMLRAARERHLRVAHGIPDGAEADLSLLKLPEGALVFPAPDGLCQLRDADAVTRTFCRKAKALGFPGLRLHDLRHTHGSRLIAAGLPITAVAARLGHTPEVLLRCYAHEIKDAEGKEQMAAVVAELAIPST